MEKLFLIVLVVLFVMALAVALKHKKSDSKYPYKKAGPLLTAAENKFYLALSAAVPDGFVLTFKVRIGDVLTVVPGLEKKVAFIMRSKIQQKHFDFVLCREAGMVPVCAIELNDSSHNKASRKKRDLFVRKACQAAELPLLEVPAKSTYDTSRLSMEITALLSDPAKSQA